MSYNYEEEDISLKDIVLKGKEYYKEVIQYKYWILIIGFVLACLFGLKAFLAPKEYKTKMTFMMEDYSRGEQSIFERLQFLGDFFGTSEGDEKLTKIKQLFQSRNIIENAILDSVVIDSNNDLLVNHYIKLKGLKSLLQPYKYFGVIPWKNKIIGSLKDDNEFRFVHANKDSFNRKENQFLSLVINDISGNPEINLDAALSSNMDMESGIMKIVMSSHHEKITYHVLTRVFESLKHFYISKAIEKQKNTFEVVKSKRDSVFEALKSAEYALAAYNDRNRKSTTLQGYLDNSRLSRQVSMLGVSYAELIKQYEMADFTLKTMTPVVQIIDSPKKHMNPRKPSIIKQSLKGFFLGMGVLLFLFIIRKAIVDLLSEELPENKKA